LLGDTQTLANHPPRHPRRASRPHCLLRDDGHPGAQLPHGRQARHRVSRPLNRGCQIRQRLLPVVICRCHGAHRARLADPRNSCTPADVEASSHRRSPPPAVRCSRRAARCREEDRGNRRPLSIQDHASEARRDRPCGSRAGGDGPHHDQHMRIPARDRRLDVPVRAFTRRARARARDPGTALGRDAVPGAGLPVLVHMAGRHPAIDAGGDRGNAARGTRRTRPRRAPLARMPPVGIPLQPAGSRHLRRDPALVSGPNSRSSTRRHGSRAGSKDARVNRPGLPGGSDLGNENGVMPRSVEGEADHAPVHPG